MKMSLCLDVCWEELKRITGFWKEISQLGLLYQKESAISCVGARCQSHQEMISCPSKTIPVVFRTTVCVLGMAGREMGEL